MVSSTIRSIALVVFILAPISVFSQTFPSLAAAADKQLLKPAELDQLVAPIALYPDPLLSEVLMASTYPLEVVQAERWLNGNKSLKGDQLKDAVDKQPWDDSVKSLTATPSVLEMMNSKIDWTQKLGNAVIDQQADVMDAIQRQRAKAQANNKLQPTEQQKVVVSKYAAIGIADKYEALTGTEKSLSPSGLDTVTLYPIISSARFTARSNAINSAASHASSNVGNTRPP